ncbi:hypothetical protein MHYP_G00307190 [Metynnis hypsauchen]
MVIRELPLEDYRLRICMKRTARVKGTVYMGSWRSQDSMQESLALESEEDFSSSDESGEDSEEERLYFEKRIDPKEDFCNRFYYPQYTPNYLCLTEVLRNTLFNLLAYVIVGDV